LKILLVRSAYFSLGLSTVITAVATEWDWLKNPNAVYRDDAGTNWQAVFDTAISWFLPSLVTTFVLFACTAIGFHLLRNFLRKIRADKALRKKSKGKDND
jgi:ABC-type dipeptide/oligopeptide/nickel transport system permease component